LTPGNDQVFREASNAGALTGFLVFIAAGIAGAAALFWFHDGKYRRAASAGQVGALLFVPYLAALTVVSLITPGMVVNIGDSYCYDLWCLGVKQVSAAPKGQDTLYTVEVRVFVDCDRHAHRIPAEQATDSFYVLDEQGRRYPLLRESFVDAGVTVQPGQSVKSSLTFLAPANARKIYLMGNSSESFLPWVYLYFGSDISLFHKRALLRIV
jgi:hypothetical protein